MPETSKLKLQFHHNIIEHLGLRLYQNKPGKVICELVSNCWDADATGVNIGIFGEPEKTRLITVSDNGTGMNRDVLQESYLTISAPRRKGANNEARTNAGRLVMGRKGIGKLAPFGISSLIDVISGSKEDGYNWISLDLSKIRQLQPDSSALTPGTYLPEEYVSNGTEDDVRGISRLPELRDAFLSTIETSKGRSGTSVGLSEISDRVRLSAKTFSEAIGRRFTVTLARPDFVIQINEKKLDETQALPDFVFRIPKAGFQHDTAGLHSVRFWVGFTEKPISKKDEVGIGVYAHGKIAQDRPFFFDISGNDFFTPYVYGVVEADWLDDFEEDLISTDRSALDWDHPQAQILKGWGQSSLRKWFNSYSSFRRDQEVENSENVIADQVSSGKLPKLTSVEQKSLVELLSDVSAKLPPEPELQSAFSIALANAWLHKPARSMLKKLWQQFKQEADGAANLAKTIETIREYLVPEALSSAVTFSQRAFALTILWELIHHGKEPDLQYLIESFPWILGRECEYLTANTGLRRVVKEAADRGTIPRTRDLSPIRESLKPDFVYLSNSTESEITVVELKSPQEDLTLEHRLQLDHYLSFFESRYPKAKLRGILVGNSPSGFEMKRSDTEWKSWSEIFLEARSVYTTILASMISGYAEDAGDPRLKEIHQFGGEAVWELLIRISEKDESLKSLLNDDRLKRKPSES